MLEQWIPTRLSPRRARRGARRPAPAVPVITHPRTCPYCLHRFPVSPVVDSDCPHCGEHVRVMRDRETGGRFLLTKEQADALRAEDARSAAGERTDLRERWLAELEQAHGVLPADLERVQRARPELDDAAGLRSLIDTLIEHKRDHGELAALYERRARLDAECGAAFIGDLARARALELVELRGLGAEYVRVEGGGCSACARDVGVRLPLQRAISGSPLPRADCARRGPGGALAPCTCRYLPDDSA